MSEIEEKYDVIVVGGGAAGLSGALALSRARRSVLVIDAGDPRNAPAGHIHNYLGRESTPPLELVAIGRTEVEGYGGTVTQGKVASTTRTDDGFRLELTDGRTVAGRKLLVATGLIDKLPDIAGLAERWGQDVLHCPYCHGWEVRDQAIGIVATTPMAIHQALMWRQWSDDVTLFLNGAFEPTHDEYEQLAAREVSVVDGVVAAIESAGDKLTGVRLADGHVIARDALVVAPKFMARTDVLTDLGLVPVELGMGDVVVGTHFESDPMGGTAVPGVWVAGNVTDLMATVIVSAAGGAKAAMAISAEFIADDTRAAVAARQVSIA